MAVCAGNGCTDRGVAAARQTRLGDSQVSIAVQCEQCGGSFRVAESLSGKRGKCPKCKAPLQVPELPATRAGPAEVTPSRAASVSSEAASSTKPHPVAAVAEPARAAVAGSPELYREVMAGFQGNIAKIREPLSYKLGALLVAVVMVLLPMIYIALIGLVCYAVYYHTVNHLGILGAARGRGALFMFLVYLSPLVIGAILILFMTKPLFARSADSRRQRSLTRDGEPLLFAFVDRLCEAVGAPRPSRIDVNCEVNASASFRRGWFSMFGSDLVLTIGMPLVAGLSMQQFAGVLAHEFGHFTQGVGMRLTYVIRVISFWFTRVVYERDQWDEWLARSTDDMDFRIAWILYLAKLFVWLTRRVLWVLMMIGHGVAGFMLRQMEFDADRHEARLAGSDTFASTARQLIVLNVAYQGAQQDLSEFMRDGRLGDDLPRLMMVNARQLPDEIHAKIDSVIAEGTTGFLDTHPCDRARIEMARREDTPGIFHSNRPAKDLFRHFESLSKNVTWDFYRDIFGTQFKPEDMHSLDDLLARQARDQDASQTLDRYFQGAFNLLRPIVLPGVPSGPPASPRQTAERLKQSRQRMLEAKPSYSQAYSLYDQADTHILQAAQATALLDAELRIRPGTFAVPTGDAAQTGNARERAIVQQRKAAGELDAFERAAAERLFAALELLHAPQLTAKLDEAPQLREEAGRLLPVLNVIARDLESMLKLRNNHAALGALCANLSGNERNEPLIDAIRDRMNQVAAQLNGLRQLWMRIDYPFDHARGQMTLAQYLVPGAFSSDDLGGVHDAAQGVLERLPPLYVRVSGRLASIAVQVETAIGLPQLVSNKNESAEG
jgi:Zn-dependent protease with chaperone function